jgi:hyperosmotically inducible periplasmic protein
MNARTTLMTAVVSLALAGLAGCNRDADQAATTSRAPDAMTPPPAATTTPVTPPAATTPPAADTTATAPASGSTTPDVDRGAGQTVDDATVTAKVKAALLAESGVDGTKINVDTFNGRVTLKGEVPSKTMIDRAVQVARGIDGVKDVDNRLNTGGAG